MNWRRRKRRKKKIMSRWIMCTVFLNRFAQIPSLIPCHFSSRHPPWQQTSLNARIISFYVNVYSIRRHSFRWRVFMAHFIRYQGGLYSHLAVWHLMIVQNIKDTHIQYACFLHIFRCWYRDRTVIVPCGMFTCSMHANF